MNQIEETDEDFSQILSARQFAAMRDEDACEKAKADRNFPGFLIAEQYLHIRPVGAYWVAIKRYIFTHAIVAIENDNYYEPYKIGCRWCYHSEKSALEALNKWDENLYQGEPEGWHRHPDTGRRRVYDDSGQYKEEIRP